MKLNQNSWHCWLYRSAYSVFPEDLPKNLCPYFWKLLGAFAMLPFSWSTHIANLMTDRKTPEHGIMQWYSFWAFVVGCLVGSLLMQDYSAPEKERLDWMFEYFKYRPLVVFILSVVGIIGGAIGLFLSICTGVAICWPFKKLAEYIIRRHYEAKEKQENTEQAIHLGATRPRRKYILTEFIKARYNKYCPKVEWEEKTK